MIAMRLEALRANAMRPSSRACFAVRCVGAVVLLAIGSAHVGAADEPAVRSIADTFSEIEESHRRDFSEARQRGASGMELVAIDRARIESCQSLLRRARQSSLEELTVDDLCALALACEYVENRPAVLEYSRAAIERDPLCEAPYASLMRTLLNLQLWNDAELLYDDIRDRFDQTSAVREHSALLCFAAMGRGDYRQGARAATDLLDYWTAVLDTHHLATSEIVRHLPRFVICHDLSDQQSLGREHIARYLGIAKQVLTKRQLEERLTPIPAEDFHLHVLCWYLASHVDPAEVEAMQEGWIRLATDAILKSPDESGMFRQIVESLSRCSELSHCWDKDTSALEAALSKLSETLRHIQQRQPEVRRQQLVELYEASESLRASVKIQRDISSIIGTVGPSTELLDSARDGGPVASGRNGMLVVVWAPDAPPGMNALRSIQTSLRSLRLSQSTDMLCVSPYRGHRWWEGDPAARAQVPAPTKEDERNVLASLLSQLPIAVKSAQFSDESDWGELCRPNCLPLLLAINQQGEVVALAMGASDAKVWHVVRAIRQRDVLAE